MKLEYKYYNNIYKGIASIEEFFPIISASSIGFTVGGQMGAAVGFALGATDYTANYFEIYEKPYLTSAVLGTGMFAKLSLPYHAQYIFGFTVGLIAPTGALNEYLEKSFTPASTALYGYSYAGQYGAATGFAAGILDEALSSYNITQKKYCSNIVQSISTTKLLAPLAPRIFEALPLNFGSFREYPIEIVKKAIDTKGAIESAGIALGSIYSYSLKQAEDNWSPMTLSNKIYNEYSELIDEKEIQKIINSQAIAIVTTSLITQGLMQKLADHYQNTRTALQSFEHMNENTWAGFLAPMKSTALFLPAYVASIISSQITTFFFSSRDLNYINDLLTAELSKGETMLKLLKNTTENEIDANSLIKRRYSDISTVTTKGSTALSEGLSSLTKGIFGINYLVSKDAQDIIIYSMIYSSAANLLSTAISTKAGGYYTIISELTDRKISLEEYFQKNADSLVQRDSNDFMQFKLEELTEELLRLDGEKFYWSTLQDTWMTAKSISDFLFNILVTAHHINTGAIKFEEYTKIAFTNEEIYPMLEWSGKNAGNIVYTLQSIDRLAELQSRMRKESTRTLPDHIYKPAQNNQEWMCLDNLEVKVGETSLITTQHQCITSNVTSVTGESNSGKSTMLNLIKGLKETLGWGSGNITFYTEGGNKPDILIASQHYNMPPYTKLLEVITLKPYAEAKLQENLIVELMREIKIDSDTKSGTTSLESLLHEEKDWNQYITSGGARKKLMALWVILEKPEIAILDEIFAGIDADAIKNIQAMFKKYLVEHGTKIMIVDHEAKAHNQDHFYEANLHVKDKTLHYHVISTEPYESITQEECGIENGILGISEQTCSVVDL